ncbi:MAG: NADH-quinone oxidoreductase subunit M [SAR324 cluster bacterium]|uniref:NADH-quinone oxidoreductase subunit M n=1 Tax=SAR324 cluster bacterium TaxID=2024889 RepID=A0A7X9IJN7_9DELT|nr:NADH-quinone oxidoreductase subunit M [SAR324 cluster bacterium]
MTQIPILSVLIFSPAFAALSLYVLPFFSPSKDESGEKARYFASFASLLVFILSLFMLTSFKTDVSTMQFEEYAEWIPEFGITYSLGVDGISLFLILLTTFLMPIVLFSSHSIKAMRKGYLASMLLLQTAMTGTLVALDLFLFYVFWELMLAPMYFIIGIWGGSGRFYATLKFVLYTVFGSVLMLVAVLYVVSVYYDQNQAISFNLETLIRATHFTLKEELWLFAAFVLAFAIKIPLFPLHTWLPDAHVEAPTGGSVILAGVLLKMGLYGLIRFAWPLFPMASRICAFYIGVLAVIGVIYGALVAWAQADMKKLVAYSSVSHLGYCVLGFVAGGLSSISGSIYQMLNHGISTGALFLIVGVLYDRKHTRMISDYSGLASKVPVFAFFFLVFTLSSIALPLTNGFVGEFLILSGAFDIYPWLTGIALFGVIFSAVYMLTLYMKTMYGELNEDKNGDLKDLTRKEVFTFVPLLLLVFFSRCRR